jgi:hypothetical protein
VITAASSPISKVIIKPPVKLILQGHTDGANVVWKDYGGLVWGDRVHVQDGRLHQ